MDMPEMKMQMSFFWGKDVEVLFPGWPANNLAMYVLSLLLVFLLSMAVEVLSISPSLNSIKSPTVTAGIQAGVYAVRMGLAYLVMLSVMSYNGGIFLVAIAGHAVGRFILFRRRVADQSQPLPLQSSTKL